ncbi:MAG: hypothetical protein IJ915_08245 [Paludibacteraceae bacterium]|nr:hypothetical protein [Paludibacteraceae bacterium]
MHGFFGSYGKAIPWDLTTFKDPSLVRRTQENHSLHLTQVTLSKFLNDKYFHSENGCFLATEGVLFEADQPSKAISRYRQGETVFWDAWRGSFAGLLYDQTMDTLLLFNDHVGSKMLFYSQTEEGFFFASDLEVLAHALNLHTFNTSFAQNILDNGCSEDNSTFLKGIYRLTAGQYLRIRGQQMEIYDYHRFDNTPYPYDEAQMVARTDALFKQAVQRVIRKNEEEKLRHFYPLSGGLDSRMSQWIARQMTQQPITNYTYSQTGHYDHLLPREISRTLGNKWQFMPLDGGDYITDVEGVCHATEWLVNYMCPVEIYHFASLQDWSSAGVILTGINGDNIFATETDNAHEMARIYTQGFNGNSLGSPLVLQHFTESYSPFCDVDVLDYVLHVPTIRRRNYFFYDRWILTCHPDAAKWHHKHELIGHRHRMVTVAGRNIPLRDVPKRIVMSLLKRLHIYDAYRLSEYSMHPYDTWIQQNPQLLRTLQAYYTNHRHLLQDTPFADVCEEKMRIGSVMEKGKVLTILSALQAFADNGE